MRFGCVAALVVLAGCPAPRPFGLGPHLSPSDDDTDADVPVVDTADTGSAPVETDLPAHTGEVDDTDAPGPSLPSVPDIQAFRYVTRLGVDADGALAPVTLDGVTHPPQLVVELTDYAGQICEVVYDLSHARVVRAQDDPSVDPALVAWLGGLYLEAGVALRPGAMVPGGHSCPPLLIFAGWMVDEAFIHDFFLSPFGGPSGYLVGIGPGLGPILAPGLAHLNQQKRLHPTYDHWSGGFIHLPFLVSTSAGTTRDLDLGHVVARVDDAMVVQRVGARQRLDHRLREECFVEHGLGQGLWLGETPGLAFTP